MSKITHIIATKFGGEWDIRAMRDDFQEIKTNVKDEFKEKLSKKTMFLAGFSELNDMRSFLENKNK